MTKRESGRSASRPAPKSAASPSSPARTKASPAPRRPENTAGSSPRADSTKGSAVGRIASAIVAAGRDADLARRSASDPAFRREVRADRRGTLSRFRTVQQALEDRERIVKQKGSRDSTPRTPKP